MNNHAIRTLRLVAICAALVAVVWIVFGQTLGHQFVNFDDRTYPGGNPEGTRGIIIEGPKWAFTHVVAANWHPLTILSHMLDCQLFVPKPGGHHFTTVLLHSLAVILLFLGLGG